MKKTKIIIISAIILGLIGIAFFIFNKRNNAITVNAVELESIVVKKTVSSSGIVESENNADLSFSSSGRLASLTAEKGSEGTEGQILARLDTYSQSQSAQALKDARDIAIREKDLYVENYVNDKSEVGGEEQYDLRIRQLNEQVSKAEASYRAQLGTISNLYVKAPFDGTILDTFKEQGEVVLAGETIIKIADLNQLYFEIELDQEDFGLVRVGQKAEIELDAYEDVIFEGTVTELPQYASTDPNSNESFIVKIQITPMNEYPVILGMTGDADIIIEQSKSEVQAVTFDKVYSDQEFDNYIWVFENNIITKTPIQIGLEGDIYTEILDNLSGTQVVVIAEETEVEGNTAKAKLSDK